MRSGRICWPSVTTRPPPSGEIRRVIAKLQAAQAEGEDPRVSA